MLGIGGERYAGGARTVDIHVSRLRSKLGGELPLLTVRRVGYKLRARALEAPTLTRASGLSPTSAQIVTVPLSRRATSRSENDARASSPDQKDSRCAVARCIVA